MLYCFQEKETSVLLFSRRRKLVQYCYQEKETGAVLFLGERNRTLSCYGWFFFVGIKPFLVT